MGAPDDADVNIQNDRGETPLYWCAFKGNENLCRLLLEHNANVNIQTDRGETPLYWCAFKGNENLCRLLLEHNANVNIQTDRGETPLYWCAFKGNENLCRLLLEHNANVNIQTDRGETPLYWCAFKGNENLCRLLLEHNADVNFQDNHGCTLLHLCARDGNENLCRLLLEHNADVNIQDNLGYTSLHLSALNSDCSKIINLLVNYGPQTINICDTEGLTPLQMAERRGNAQAVKMLVDLGADVSVVKANKTDARRLKPLKNEAERMEEHLKFEMGSAQKASETKYTTGVASVQGAESRLKSEKILKPTPSYTYTKKEVEELRQTASKTTKEMEKEPQAEQVKTLAVGHQKSTTICVMV